MQVNQCRCACKEYVHFNTTDAHLSCPYAHELAQIDLKIYMGSDRYVDILGFEFKKDLCSGCREINVL